MDNRASWNRQFNLFIFDLEDGSGINISTVIQVSKHTGRLVIYEGIRHRFAKEIRIYTPVGAGLSPEDMVRYEVMSTMRELKKKSHRREIKPKPPSCYC